MGWDRKDSRQGTLELRPVLREPTRAELQAAYEFCVADKGSLPFDRALTMPPMVAALKTVAKKAMLKRGGV